MGKFRKIFLKGVIIVVALWSAMMLMTYKNSNWYGTLLYYHNKDTFDALAQYAITYPEANWDQADSLPAEIRDIYQTYDSTIAGWQGGKIMVIENDFARDEDDSQYAVAFLLYFASHGKDSDGCELPYHKYLLYTTGRLVEELKFPEGYVESARHIHESWYVVTVALW